MPKSNYAPPPAAIEYSRAAPDNTPAPVCYACGDVMNHHRTIPKLGVRPELLVFVCPSCKEFAAKHFERVA